MRDIETYRQQWTEYTVTLQFITQLCGSVPSRAELVESWLDARKPRAKPPGGKSIEETQEEVFSTLAEGTEEQPTFLTFQRLNAEAQRFTTHAADAPFDGRLALRASTFKSHLKDCSRVLSTMWVGKLAEEKALSTRVINCVYTDLDRYWVPITTGGAPIYEPSGLRDKAVHVRDPRTGAPLNSLKRFEYVLGATVTFPIWVMGGTSQRTVTKKAKAGETEPVETTRRDTVSEGDLRHVLTYGSVHGYGGERSDGEGRYIFDLKRA